MSDLRPKYVSRKAFVMKVNGVTIAIKQGQVIEDQTMLLQMKRENAPIDPVLDEDDLLICPHCGMGSSRGAQESARMLLRRAKQLMPGHV